MQFFKTVAATERYAEAQGGVGKTVPISAFSGNKDALNTLGNTIFCRLLYCRHTTGRLAGIARMGRMGNGTGIQSGLRSGIGAHRREGLCARLARRCAAAGACVRDSLHLWPARQEMV